MPQIKQLMMTSSNINGKKNWKTIEAKGNEKEGLNIIIKEKNKPVIKQKIPLPQLSEYINNLDNDNKSIFDRVDDLFYEDEDFSPPPPVIIRSIKFPKRKDILSNEKRKLALKKGKKKRRRRKKTNKRKAAKSKQKTLKKRKKKEKEMSIFNDIF